MCFVGARAQDVKRHVPAFIARTLAVEQTSSFAIRPADIIDIIVSGGTSVWRSIVNFAGASYWAMKWAA